MKPQNEINRRSFSAFGFSTILIAFVMIAVITFSALALITANADYRLSRKVADRTSAYYEAEALAYDHLAAMDQILEESYSPYDNQSEYYDHASEALQSYGQLHPELSLLQYPNEDGLLVTYEIGITESQTLSVGLRVTAPSTNGGVYYDLTCWQTKTDTPDIPDEQPLNLLGS